MAFLFWLIWSDVDICNFIKFLTCIKLLQSWPVEIINPLIKLLKVRLNGSLRKME
jgi:hypothetical protein